MVSRARLGVRRFYRDDIRLHFPYAKTGWEWCHVLVSAGPGAPPPAGPPPPPSAKKGGGGGERGGWRSEAPRVKHVTPLPPCLSITRVEADVVAVATTDAETST